MDLKLKGKRALVMGASAGLGRGVAHSLIQEGAQVAICARNEEKLKKTAKEIGAALAVPADLSQKGAAKILVEKVIKEFGGIDIVVTNTGGPPKGFFTELTTEQWLVGFQGLWLSAVEAINAALPSMKEQKFGRILLITSVAAKEPMHMLTVSNGLRAGLLGLTKSLSQEVATFGVTVNAILPGYTRTERLVELGVDESKMTSQIPAGRLGEPQELGDLTAYLASPRAAYITGQAIAIDGGYLKGI